MEIDVDEFEQFLSARNFTADELMAKVADYDFLRPYKPGNPFPLGITITDAVRVRIQADSSNIGDALSALTGRNGIRSVKVFPVGIPAPELFEIDVELGRRFGN